MISGDCSAGEICHAFAGESFCVAACTGDSDCANGQSCIEGASGGVCGGAIGPCSQEDVADGGPSLDVDAGREINPDAGADLDGGVGPGLPPFTSNLTAAGGTESQLLFAVVGDTRPSLPDISSYPTDIITKIFQDIESLNPRPAFVIGTGDYQFTLPDLGTSQQQKQLGAYMSARMQYSGVFWPAMGNHECDSITADVCGPGTLPGVPANFTVYQSMFLSPIGETNPWFSRTVTATDGSWSAHFIFVAPNYWTDAESTWLQQQISGSKATYTFVIHHENKGASGPPPALATIEALEAGHETLSIVGHTHQWHHDQGSRELIVGNGGAPLDVSGQSYGYTLVAQQPNGSLLVTAHDYMSNAVTDQFTVAP